jgi:hypothetical protein
MSLVKEGLLAMKSGYRDEKEEMSGKNVEVLIVGTNGVRIINSNEVNNIIG